MRWLWTLGHIFISEAGPAFVQGKTGSKHHLKSPISGLSSQISQAQSLLTMINLEFMSSIQFLFLKDAFWLNLFFSEVLAAAVLVKKSQSLISFYWPYRIDELGLSTKIRKQLFLDLWSALWEWFQVPLIHTIQWVHWARWYLNFSISRCCSIINHKAPTTFGKERVTPITQQLYFRLPTKFTYPSFRVLELPICAGCLQGI